MFRNLHGASLPVNWISQAFDNVEDSGHVGGHAGIAFNSDPPPVYIHFKMKRNIAYQGEGEEEEQEEEERTSTGLHGQSRSGSWWDFFFIFKKGCQRTAETKLTSYLSNG